MSQHENLVAELKNLMKCPVDWWHVDEEDRQPSILELDWHYSLRKFAVNDAELPDAVDLLEEIWEDTNDDLSYLRGVLINLRATRPLSEKHYFEEGAGRLSGLRFLSPADHGKHYRPGLNRQEVVSKSMEKVSLLFEDHSVASLQEAFWWWLVHYFDHVTDDDDYEDFIDPEKSSITPEGQKWRAIRQDHQVRICLNAVCFIGATLGIETTYLCFDVHINTKVVHCYPVAKHEAIRMMGDEAILAYDGINC